MSQEAVDKKISEIMRYYNASDKKHIRSKVLFSTAAKVAKSRGGLKEEMIAKMKVVAEAIEQIHSASIIHDDILDKATSRRGLESLNQKYGNHLALIAGDAMFAQSLSIMSSVNEGYAISHLIVVLRKMTSAQLEELIWSEEKHIPDGDELMENITKKTGSLMGLSARLGAYFALNCELSTEEDVKDLDDIAILGETYGVAFQIYDDIEDMDEDEENNVWTIPRLFGVEKATELADKLKHNSTIEL